MKKDSSDIVERTDKSIDPKRLSELTEEIGWGSREDEKWTELLGKSKYVYSLFDKEKLVGFGRILEDGTMAMFYDIMVHPDYQRKKLGVRVMDYLLAQIQGKGYASVGLFAWDKNPGAMEFYKKCGFSQVEFGMKLKLD